MAKPSDMPRKRRPVMRPASVVVYTTSTPPKA